MSWVTKEESVAAIIKNFNIEAGATFNIGFVYHGPVLDAEGNPVLDDEGKPIPGDPISLAGCEARMQVRQKVADEDALITVTTEPDPIDGWRGIVLESPDDLGDPITGRVDIELTDLDTMKLQSLKTAVYDLELVWPLEAGDVRKHVDRLMQGTLVVDKNVTRVETGA